jgi:two-component system, OmpR family, sensor histidine kinase KdpD
MPNDEAPNTGAPAPQPTGAQNKPGVLKIFLGYASGVGKTYSMLDEAHRRKNRGQDVVVGYVEEDGRQSTKDLLQGLEIIPTRTVEVEGKSYHEIDVDAVIARKPEVVLVDNLAHNNPPGSKNSMRWQDAELLRSAGINVLGTVNIANIESLTDHVEDITGMPVKNTIPDSVLHRADEVELIDLTPRALINRLERGDVVSTDKIGEYRTGLYREGNLMALREIALREAAGRVDEDVLEYRKEKRIERPWAMNDKVMICISPTRSSLRQVRKGWRMAQRLHGEALVVYVDDEPVGIKEQKILDSDITLAERLGLKTVKLKGNTTQELIRFARENSITQIVLGHSSRSRWQEILKGSIATELARALKTVDIMLVAADIERES